jgi:hypothetical protein
MITRIGLTAGDIWNHLDSCSRRDTLERIVSTLGTEKEIILMSIGWLAREGHVVLEGEGPNYTVRLVSISE